MAPLFWSLELDSFDPSIHSEMLKNSSFDQRLLQGGRFKAVLRRFSSASAQLDWGCYSLPAVGSGCIPLDLINIGFTLSKGIPAWVNGRPLHPDDLQIYAENSPVDYRCVPNSPWTAFQISRCELQQAAIEALGYELKLPRKGMHNLRMPPAVADELHQVVENSLRVASSLRDAAAHGRNGVFLHNELVLSVIRAIDACSDDRDGRKLRAARRQVAIFRASQSLAEWHDPHLFSLAHLRERCDCGQRSLAYFFEDIYDMSPCRWLLIARLHGAHHDLATDTEQTRVRDVAIHWGFLHLGRFAHEYERLFGERPHQTLTKRQWTANPRARNHVVPSS